MKNEWSTYQEWLEQRSRDVTRDSLWNLEVYRAARFALDLGQRDTSKLTQATRRDVLSSQLVHDLESAIAILSEGHARRITKHQARSYEKSLDLIRDCRERYQQAGHIYGERVVDHRVRLMEKISRLLVTMIAQLKGIPPHERDAPYVQVGPRIRYGSTTPTDNFFEPEDDPYDDIPFTGE